MPELLVLKVLRPPAVPSPIWTLSVPSLDEPWKPVAVKVAGDERLPLNVLCVACTVAVGVPATPPLARLTTNWLPANVEAPLLEKVLSVTTRSVSVPPVFSMKTLWT